MRLKLTLGIVAMVATTALTFVLQSQPSQAPPLTLPEEAITALPMDPTVRTALDEQAVIAMTDEAVRRKVRQLSQSSNNFVQLPESDQEWVIQKAALSFFVGQIRFNELSKKIDQLATARKQTVEQDHANPYL